jgi:hypothetical protein
MAWTDAAVAKKMAPHANNRKAQAGKAFARSARRRTRLVSREFSERTTFPANVLTTASLFHDNICNAIEGFHLVMGHAAIR